MYKAVITAVAAVALMVPTSAAFAYSSSNVVVNGDTPVHAGSSEVDLSYPSYVKANIAISDAQSTYWVTAGDVASGNAGYGFFIHNDAGSSYDRLFAVTNDGMGTQRLLPLGFIPANTAVKLLAIHDPVHGLTVCVESSKTAWKEYGLGVISANEFSSAFRGLGAFNASVADHNNASNLFVGSWDYVSSPLGTYGSEASCAAL